MGKLSSTAQGDLFEDKVFQIFSDLLFNDELSVIGKKSKIFQKRKYYSKDRNSDIIVDISIETYMDGAKDYSLLHIIECKDLGRNISVEKIETLDSRLRQLGEHNTKGIIVSRSPLQSSGLEIAKNKGIGVVIINNESEVIWELHRKKPELQHMEEEKVLSYLSYSENEMTKNFCDLLITLGVIDYPNNRIKTLSVPFRSKTEITKITEKFQQYDLYDDVLLDLDKLYLFLSDKYPGLEFDKSAELGAGILGKIEIGNLKISISDLLKDDKHRTRFTLAHEIGHLVLHKRILTNISEGLLDSELSMSGSSSIDNKAENNLEIQANIFASSLLIPDNFCIKIAKEYFKDKNIYENYIWFDFQPCNQELGHGLISRISYRFCVSSRVATIKLRGLGLLKSPTDL